MESNVATQDNPPPSPPCRHDSSRRDGSLDTHCLRCGADGYWHYGHRHDATHPSGKTLINLGCPDMSSDVSYGLV